MFIIYIILSQVEMLQCNSVNYTNTCQLYPANKYVCSRFLENKYIYNEYGNSEYFHYLNGIVRNVKYIFGTFIARDLLCTHLFVTLMCHTMFPRCIPSSTSDIKKQTICEETCNSMHNQQCKTFLQVMKKFLHNEKYRVNERVSRNILTLFQCEKFPSKHENALECLSFVGKYDTSKLLNNILNVCRN